VTSASERAAAEWRDSAFVEAWVDRDASRRMLDLPRAIAAAIVASEGEPVRLVLDVAAGTGVFLAAFLSRFPAATGVWCDGSEAMLRHARASLAPVAARTDFILGDMRDLGSIGLSGHADVVVSSRASHHLDDDELYRFYAQCAALVRPGGWVANLDHVGPATAWERRYRDARAEVVGAPPAECAHVHRDPLAGLGTHLDALYAAGFVDVDVAWKAFHTALVMGRTPATR